MPQIRLSIIIPFYNVEKYIAQCLDSVYAQDIPESEYEVICVNDCSPDNSREIVLAYQHNHSNLKLIEHEKNEMLGAARNTGLRAARGKYVWFIDSDDYIKESCLKLLLNVSEKNDLDVLHFNIRKLKDGVFSCYKHIESDGNLTSGHHFLKNIHYNSLSQEAWSLIYSRELLIHNELFFLESVYFEDTLFKLQTLLLSKRMIFLSDELYIYRYNDNSIMNGLRKSGEKLADWNDAFLERIRFVDKYYPELDTIIPACLFYLEQGYGIYWSLSLLERKKYINRLKIQNINELQKYFSVEFVLFYTYPNLVYNLSPILWFWRKVKRKIFKILHLKQR